MIVFVLAAAMASATPVPEARSGGAVPVVQATATVRIVAGARITSTELPRDALVRDTRVTGSDGVERNARLVEFP